MTVLSASGLTLSFGDEVIFSDVSFAIFSNSFISFHLVLLSCVSRNLRLRYYYTLNKNFFQQFFGSTRYIREKKTKFFKVFTFTSKKIFFSY